MVARDLHKTALRTRFISLSAYIGTHLIDVIENDMLVRAFN